MLSDIRLLPHFMEGSFQARACELEPRLVPPLDGSILTLRWRQKIGRIAPLTQKCKNFWKKMFLDRKKEKVYILFYQKLFLCR